MNQLSYEISNNKFINTGFQFNSSITKEINNTIKSLKQMNYENID